MKRTIRVAVNGSEHERTVESRMTLADFLRDELQLTGTHLGCEHGVCGACTVLIDGEPARSCLTLAVQVDACAVTTVEGLADGDRLHPLQEAFLQCGGAQCGICTPGMILAALHLLKKKPDPTIEDIREGLSGNLCRCTGYIQIFEAVVEAARRRPVA